MDQLLTFGDYAAVLRRRILWIVGAIVVCLLIAFGYSRLQKHRYEASATVVVSNVAPPSFLGGSGASSATTMDRTVATQAAIASSPAVARATLSAAGVAKTMTPQEFLATSSVAPDSTANTIHFTVDAPSSALASKLATDYAERYIAYERSLVIKNIGPTLKTLKAQVAQLSAASSNGTALAAARTNLAALQTYISALQTQTTLSGGAGHASLVQPNTKRDLLMGLAAGIAIGVILAFVMNAVDDRIYSVRRFAAESGLPMIGVLPSRSWLRRQPIASSDGRIQDQARRVATRLGFARNALHAKTLLLTSADPAVGSSEASAWLAWGLAEIGNRVVLLDVDTARAGEASAMLELPQRNAPSRRKRSDGTAFEQQLIERETPAGGRLSALPATAAADASATLTPAGVGGFLQRVRDDADVVLLNVPAITDSSWALVLTEHADAMVVVARLPRTRRADVARLRDAVAWTPTPALGAVVVGGEGHADPASAPPMTSSNGAKKDPLTLESWARDIVSQGG